MTTLVLILLAAAVVAFLLRQASTLDVRDETDRFARVQSVVAQWSDNENSPSHNDLGPTR